MALCVSVSRLSTQRSLWGPTHKGHNNSEKHIHAHLFCRLKPNQTPRFGDIEKPQFPEHQHPQRNTIGSCRTEETPRSVLSFPMTVGYLLSFNLCDTQVDRHPSARTQHKAVSTDFS